MTPGLRTTAATVAAIASYSLLAGVSPGTSQADSIPPLPYDVNGDGYADVVVGAPGEVLDSLSQAGMFHLLYGSASGTRGVGSVAIHQDTEGVPGVVEFMDDFGASNTSGDFNGDGYADVAVSGPGEDLGRGAVWVFYGSARGLRTGSAKILSLRDTALPVPERGAAFGHGIAAGDFNGDGRDDLAVGSLALGPGHVSVFHGTGNRGFSHAGDFSQDTPGVPGTDHDGDWFGVTVAAGDINGDGRDDLAVGAPVDSEDRGWQSGSVTVCYAGPGGLTGTGAQRWTKDAPGVPGATGSFDDEGDGPDSFGWELTLADFSGDGRADLAVGAYGAPVTVDGTRKADAGTVTVLYSDGSRIGTTNAVEVTQQTSGMPGTAGSRDRLGMTLAAGDATGDGISELAAFSPGDDHVTVIPGGFGGLRYAGAAAWTQDSPGIPGVTEPGDWWGGSLRFVDVKGTGRASLVVGADAENSDRGAITVIHSSRNGLTGVGAQYLSQDTPGVPGVAEVPDMFGTF
jgi:hypothetical protein